MQRARLLSEVKDTSDKLYCEMLICRKFVAADIEQFEVTKKIIDLCVYYVLIIGKRYSERISKKA